MPWISRAIWSAPPPVPAGTTNSTGLVGSQPAANAGVDAVASKAATVTAAEAIARRLDSIREAVCMVSSPVGGAEIGVIACVGSFFW